MHVAVLSDPNNFHTRKWALALMRAGVKVTVFSFDKYTGHEVEVVCLNPSVRKRDGSYHYLSYLLGGAQLRRALAAAKVDVVCALNVTPFGVWGRRAGRRPLISVALGADILEFPPQLAQSPMLATRSWDAEGHGMPSWKRWIFRSQVASTLRASDMVLADNQWLVSCMEDWFHVPKGTVKLLRWGVEPERFDVSDESLESLRSRYGIRNRQRLVLSPRGAKRVYQADVIVEAFAKRLEQGDKDTFYLMLSAGYGISPEVEQRACELEARHPNFKLERGMLDRGEVYALWNLVDVFISAPIYDGYSAALAEGRFVGAVPVVNGIPANLELIRHQVNGWITSPFTAEQLAADLGEILKDVEGWKARFATLNRNWIEDHSIMQRNAARFVEWAIQLYASPR